MMSPISNRFIRLILSGSVLASATAVVAQDSSDFETQALEELIIVGSRTPGRSVEDSPVPIDIISADDLEQSASIGGEVGNLLQANIPSFNLPRQSNSDQADIVRAAQLRGLSPDHTLVLINGKRRHVNSVISVESKLGRGSAPVDFNTIPTNAIERIEVLRDGAAAQYGSDAIAGVINIALKDSADEGRVNLSYGAHSTSPDPTGTDITDGQTALISINKGFSVADGFINLSAEYRDRAATNRAGFDQLPTIGFGEFIVPIPSSDAPEAAPNNALAGRRNYLIGDGESESLALSYNAGFNLSSGFDLYSFGTYSDRDAEGYNFFRYPVSENNVTSVFPNGFVPITVAAVTDYFFAAGTRGVLSSGWSLDASLTHGLNDFDQDTRNSINSSLGASSPTFFNIAEFQYSQTLWNIETSKEFNFDGGASMNFAAGLEYRTENYETTAGDPASYQAGANADGSIGAQGGAGLQPEDTADADRDSYSAFIDMEFDMTEKLLIATALRYEDYEDFGTTTNWKLAGRWELFDGLALRGAASTGFRAPALAQAFFAGRSTSFGTGGALVNSVNLPVSDPLAVANGAQKLQAEESDSLSVGFTYGVENFRLTFDYYAIDIDDRISLSETLDVSGNGIDPTIESIRFFTNVVDTETTGFDIVASYDIGNWDISLAYNDTDTDVVKTDSAVFSIEEINTLETAAPESKLIFSSRWSNDQFSVLARATRYGDTMRVFDFGDGFEPAQVYSSVTTIDADIQWRITDSWNLGVGANNLLDEYPDESIFDISYFGNLPYDAGVAPAGVNGRYAYLRTSYDF